MSKKLTEYISFKDYEIIREEKAIIFQDTNVIEDTSKYLIQFNKQINLDTQYLLITPFSYFRIPEDIRAELRPELMELEPMELYHRIIWYYIFEVIFKNDYPNYQWIEISKEISRKLSKDSEKIKKRLSKERIMSESTKERIKSINLKDFIEKKRNIKEILEYPNFNTKRIPRQKHTPKTFLIIFLVLSGFLLNSCYLFNHFIDFFTLWVVLSCVLIIAYFLFYKLIIGRAKIKKDLLMKKLEDIIPLMMPEFNNQIKSYRDLIKKYLRAYAEDLFQRIFFNEYNNLFEVIKDYKTFNPFSLSVKFDNEDYHTEPHFITQFFRYITISLDFSDIKLKPKYELSIQTKRTIRIIRKRNRLTREEIIVSKTGWFILMVLFVVPTISYFFVFALSLKFSLFLFSIILVAILISLGIKFNFKYYSGLQEIRKQKPHKLTLFWYLRNKYRKIYSIPSNLRRNCSFDWVINAPQFHNVRMCSEVKKIFKSLERPIVIRLPHDLYKNVLSFHVPKSKNIREVDFQLDLELPFMSRIIGWLIGMNIMLINMLSLSLIYLIFTFSPVILLDFTNIRVILPFLTLLIGFFGKNILESPTKDLHKWAGILISLTVIIGLLLFVSSIIDLLIY